MNQSILAGFESIDELGIDVKVDSQLLYCQKQTFTLAQVCRRLSSGKSIAASDISDSGSYPVYGANGVRGYTSVSNFKGECAIIGRQGAYCGNVHYFTGEAYMSEHAVVAHPNELADARYLAYLLSLMDLSRLQGQSAQPGLSVQTLAKQKIQLPNIATQHRIGKLLGALDKKIELNRQINHNLEAMAQALYDYWFVQFDFPDENGKPYKSSGGKMVWNEELKREIPEGWKVQALSEHANIIMGSSPEGISLNEDGRGVVFFQGCADFGEVFPKERVYTTQPKRMAIEGSILISVRAPVGQQNIAEKECCIGRGVAALTSKFNQPAYLWQEIAHLSYFFDRYNGEGSIFGCINKDELHSLPVLTSPAIIDKYEEIIGSIYLRRLSIARETKKLQLHRDFLLPLLMNGQVTITPQGEELNYDLTSD